MAKKVKLSKEEQEFVDNQSKWYNEAIESIERASQFKEGDYLVLYMKNWQGIWEQETNTYGAPAKYRVVHVSEKGIPFVKKVTIKDGLQSRVRCCVGMMDYDGDFLDNGATTRWELDPAFADSLILQEEYDHATVHKERKERWKEVTDHNKKARVNTKKLSGIAEFFATVQPGNSVWTSNARNLVINEAKCYSREEAKKLTKISQKIKGSVIMVITITDPKGVTKLVTVDHFQNKALYRERPRTYKELNL